MRSHGRWVEWVVVGSLFFLWNPVKVGAVDWVLHEMERSFSAPVVGDLDGNGEKDLVFVNTGIYGDRKLYAMDAKGHMMPGAWPVTVPYGNISVGDLDGDDHLEIVLTSTQGILVFDYTGHPLWSQATDSDFVTYNNGTASVLGDLNHDGSLEIIACQIPPSWPLGGSVRLFVWNKDGQLLPGWPKTIGVDASHVSIAVGQFKRTDRTSTIIVGSHQYSGAYPSYIVAYDPSGKELWKRSWSSAHAPILSLGDVNHDGDLEVVYGIKTFTSGYKIGVLMSDGRSFSEWNSTLGFSGYSDLALGNLDDNPDLEIVALTHGSSDTYEMTVDNIYRAVQVWKYNGTPLGSVPTILVPPTAIKTNGFHSLSLSDLDGDSRQEVVVGTNGVGAEEQWYGLKSDGSILETQTLTREPYGLGNGPTIVQRSTIADLDNDGQLELIVASTGQDLIDPIKKIYKPAGYLFVKSVPSTSSHGELAWPASRHDARRTAQYPLPFQPSPPNQAPFLDSIEVPVFNEGRMGQFAVTAHDPDSGSHLILSARMANGEPLESIGATLTDRGDGTGTFAWTPSFDVVTTTQQHRELSVLFEVSDGSLSDSQLVTLNVLNVNRRPQLVVTPDSPQTIKAGQPVQISLSASDLDGDALTYSMSPPIAGATIDPATGAFAWTPDATQGTPEGKGYAVTFAVTDSGNLSDSKVVTITVIEPFDYRLTNGGNLSVEQGKAVSTTITITKTSGLAQAVGVAISGLPTGATAVFEPGIGCTPATECAVALTIQTSRDTPAGTSHLIVTGAPLGKITAFDLTLKRVNTPPRLAEIQDRSVLVGEPLSFAVSANDPDGDALTYTYSANPPLSGATIDPATGAFTWTPLRGQAGTYAVQFSVSDGSIAVTQQRATIITVNTMTVSGTVYGAGAGALVRLEGLGNYPDGRSVQAMTDAQGRYVLADVHLASGFAAAISKGKKQGPHWLIRGWVRPSKSGFVMVPVKRLVSFDVRTWRNQLNHAGVNFNARRRSR